VDFHVKVSKKLRKLAQFWRAKIEERSSSPRRLWRSIDQLMSGEKQAGSPDISAADFYKFFIDKIAGVRALTDAAGNLAFRHYFAGTYSSRLTMRK